MGPNFTEDLKNNVSRIQYMEQMLGNTLQIPYCASDSGARKILANKQKEQSFVTIYNEQPIIGTGYENKFGDESSSLYKTDSDYVVIAKIPKFSFNPNHHYYMIMRNLTTNKLHLVERVSYKFKTEVYGFLYNNVILDKLVPNQVIPKGTVIKKSNAYDEYNNRTDVVNLRTIYLTNDRSMEDGVVISESASKKLSVPLFHPVKAMIPENMIPLNIYGDDKIYKCIPDIGQEIKNGQLLILRQDRKEESLFNQAYSRLKTPMMSDERFTVRKGTVIDIDVYNNRPELFEDNIYLSQFKMYYDEKIRCANDIVQVVLPLVSAGYELDYQLDKLFYRSKQLATGCIVNDDKASKNNITVNIMVMEENPANIGDKMADRHGGKGVISTIIPDNLMPILPNGKRVEVLKNKSTMYNRENPGQNFELSNTYIGDCILDIINSGKLSVNESFDYIYRYMKIVSPIEAKELLEYIENEEKQYPRAKEWYVDSVLNDGCIRVDPMPISENMDIYKLDQLYKEFPEIKPCKLQVPIKDSNGNIRFVNSMRTFVPGRQAMTRMKQYAEEKFSVTSLAATTIKNENTRSHASKNYKEVFADTPIKFGQMESDQENHMGAEYVVTNLMLHSLSPHGRRLVAEMYTGDPFNVDIKLDKTCSNREVEILNAYLKTMGLKLIFVKKKKKKKSVLRIHPIRFLECQEKQNVVSFLSEEDKKHFNPDEFYAAQLENYNKTHKPGIRVHPITWIGKDEEKK